MAILDGHALSMLIQLSQEPIILASEDYTVLDINNCAEKILNLKKNHIIGTSLTHYCSNNDFTHNYMRHNGSGHITMNDRILQLEVFLQDRNWH